MLRSNLQAIRNRAVYYDLPRITYSNFSSSSQINIKTQAKSEERKSNPTSSKRKPRVVILGTGWGGNCLARSLDKSIFDVRLISPANHFLFTPLLPSTSVGTLEFRAVQEPVRTIKGLSEYYQAKARSLDTVNQMVHCQDVFKGSKFDVAYDFLVVSVGNKTNTFNTPGVAEREGNAVYFLKHLHHARQIRNRILECFERAGNPTLTEMEKNRLLSFIVVGGGPTACEFISELHEFLVNDVSKWYPDLYPHAKLTLVEAGDSLLGSFDKSLSEYYLKNLLHKNIDVRTKTAVTAVEGRPDDHGEEMTTAIFSDGSEMLFGMMVWSAGLAPVKFTANSGLPTMKPGQKIVVDEYLKVEGHNGRVFAIGDCAGNENNPLPPTAMVAEQQGIYLSDCFNKYYKDFDVVNQPKDAILPNPGPVYPALFPWSQTRFLDKIFASATPHFQYMNRGSMAVSGSNDGVVDLKKTDLPMPKVGISGTSALAAWRGAYFSKQLSINNMILVPMFWFKTMVFGRDISRF